jgi:hypothetical protein
MTLNTISFAIRVPSTDPADGDALVLLPRALLAAACALLAEQGHGAPSLL